MPGRSCFEDHDGHVLIIDNFQLWGDIYKLRVITDSE